MADLYTTVDLGTNVGVINIKTFTNALITVFYARTTTTYAQLLQLLFENYQLKNFEQNTIAFQVAPKDIITQDIDKMTLVKDMRFPSDEVVNLVLKPTIVKEKVLPVIERAPDYYTTGFAINIKMLTGKTARLLVHETMYLWEVKKRIQEIEGIPVDIQRYIFSGAELEDEKQIRDYFIAPEASLHLVMRLRGGMFHETSGRNGNYEQLQSAIFYLNIEDFNKNENQEV